LTGSSKRATGHEPFDYPRRLWMSAPGHRLAHELT
jgi:hypothetical protein